MGDSYRDYVKSRSRAGRRAGQTVTAQAAVEARARAIREHNRKIKAAEAQGQLRLHGF